MESEKKFLDLAAHEVTAAMKGDKRTHKPPRERMEVLTKVAREGVEKYIETQEKLLELVIKQSEDTAKAGREHKEKARKQMQPLLGELTEKSMKNFVNAEKSLLDLAVKTRLHTERTPIKCCRLFYFHCSGCTPVRHHFTAPTVKPAMKLSRKRLYRNATGRLAIRQAAINAPQ